MSKYLCEAVSITTNKQCKCGRTSGCTVEVEGMTYFLCRAHYNRYIALQETPSLLWIKFQLINKESNMTKTLCNLIFFTKDVPCTEVATKTVRVNMDVIPLCQYCYANIAINPEEVPMPEIPESYIFTMRADDKCHKCNGTGTYVWGAIVNGVPERSGTCFRCDGSGKNWVIGDRQIGMIVSLVPFMTEEEWNYITTQIFLPGGFDFARTCIEYFTQPVNPKPTARRVVTSAPRLGKKGIRCGYCHQQHATSADVRACGTK